MGEGRWKVVNWKIELFANCQVCEGAREIIYWLAESVTKDEVGEGEREMIDRKVEAILKILLTSFENKRYLIFN